MFKVAYRLFSDVLNAPVKSVTKDNYSQISFSYNQI